MRCDEKQLRILRLAALAQDDNPSFVWGGEGVVLSQVSESRPGAPRFVVRDEFSGQIFRCAQDDSMKWFDAGGWRQCGSSEKQLRILRLAALAQDDNSEKKIECCADHRRLTTKKMDCCGDRGRCGDVTKTTAIVHGALRHPRP